MNVGVDQVQNRLDAGAVDAPRRGRWARALATLGLAAAMVGGIAVSTAAAHPYGPPHVHPHRAAPPRVAPAPRAAPRRGFVKVADKIVSDHFDRDVIVLPGRRRFNEMKLCVRHRAVEFFDLDVRFANGANQDVAIRRVIGPGQCTRNIQLAGRGPRNIDRIVMKYSSLRKRGPQPVVSVYVR